MEGDGEEKWGMDTGEEEGRVVCEGVLQLRKAVGGNWFLM